MNQKSPNERILFGLKIKQLRRERQLNFADFARETGISVSYLNEIEKGKKFPKEDKLNAMAMALGVTPSELASPVFGKNLAPVAELLNSNFLQELPLDLFDIDLSKVVEIIAGAPVKVGAFISTLVDLSRNYALAEEHFYFGALRSYLELHSNYFEDIEQSVDLFITRHKLPTEGQVPIEALTQLLREQFGYTIVESGLGIYPELSDVRSVFVPRSKKLLLNERLTDLQRAFQFAKELGFNHLALKERANTASLQRPNSFDEVLNHYKAGYFAAALLIGRVAFVKDLEAFFQQARWDGEFFLRLLSKYQASPEMLMHRAASLLPAFFGLDKLFLLRHSHDTGTGQFKLFRELHLDRRHESQSNALNEHYCRRQLPVSLLEDLSQMQHSGKFAGVLVSAQRSVFFETGEEFLVFTLARPSYPSPQRNVSVTLGMLVNDALRQKVGFLEDPALLRREVHTTCERCPLENCAERAAPPSVVLAKNQRRRMQKILKEIEEKG